MPVLIASGMLARPPMMKQAMQVLAAVAVIKFFLVSSCKFTKLSIQHSLPQPVTCRLGYDLSEV